MKWSLLCCCFSTFQFHFLLFLILASFSCEGKMAPIPWLLRFKSNWKARALGLVELALTWLGLSHVPFLQPITVARVIACSHWPGISHMLESGVESALPEAWRLRVGEGCLPVPKIRMLIFMEVSVSGCRASETTVYFSDWSIWRIWEMLVPGQSLCWNSQDAIPKHLFRIV